MKIALLHYSYAPVPGGVELVIAEHVALFEKHGHEVTCIPFPPPTATVEAIVEEMTPQFQAADIAIIHNVFTMPFHPACTSALWQIASALSEPRFIGWVHDLAACNPDYDLPDRDPWRLLAMAHPNVSYVAVSDLRARQFENLTSALCRVIPNGIDPISFLNLTEPVACLAHERRLLQNDLVLLHPTRILKRKNIELGLHTIAVLKARGLRCTLLITGPPDAHNPGSDDYLRALNALSATLGIEREILFVHALFTVTRCDLVGLYELSDVLFYPSAQEGFGIPMLEAAIHRLPAFCADIEPLRSLGYRNVTFFNPRIDPERLAGELSAFVAGCAAIQNRKFVIENYSWESIYTTHLAPLLNPAITPL